MHELLKIPALILHYSEHTQSQDLNFIEFLHNHYCAEHHHCDHEGETNHELPFQCRDCAHPPLTCVVESIEQLSFPKFELPLEYSRICCSHIALDSIIDFWQPPKA